MCDSYAKQLIEDTIRRNASPVRLGDAPQGGGSCSSLASSASDEAAVVAAAAHTTNAAANNIASNHQVPSANVYHHQQQQNQQQLHNHLHNQLQQQQHHNNNNHSAMKMRSSTSGGPSHHLLHHSLSTNDASLGEYKYTVGVGVHSIKITGDCFELVRIAKLVLDDYFNSSDFLASVEASAAYAETGPTAATTTATTTPATTPTTPAAHQLTFADSGIGLNYLSSGGGGRMGGISGLGHSLEAEDDVFVGGETSKWFLFIDLIIY